MFSLAKKLSLTVRGVMASAIDNLFTALKGRATYSENIADSKQVVKDIDNYELLDKASILLTPTAYSDARVHSVKTYTGDELVTNGTFDTDVAGWGTDSGAELTWQSDQTCLVETTADSTFAIVQNDVLTIGNTYKVSLRFKPNNNGTFRVRLGGSSVTFSTSSFNLNEWNYVEFVGVADNSRLEIGSSGGSISQFYLDNVSVVDVSSDFDFDRASSATRINSDGLVQDMQSITDPELVLNGDFEELGDEEVTNGTFDTDSDWTLGSGWSIEDGKAVRVASSSTDLVQASVFPNLTSIFKITFDVVRSAGSVRLRAGTFNLPYVGATDTYTYYVTPTSNDQLKFQADSSFVGSIDNVSVQQVDPNDRWTLGTGWSVEDGVAEFNGTTAAISQNIGLITSNIYQITFTLNINQGGIAPVLGGSVQLDTITTSGTHTVQGASGANSLLYFQPVNFGGQDFQGTIDNISVKDITFSEDVDLARINYDSNGENGHWLLEPTSTNLITYSEDFSEWTLGINSTLTYESDVVAPDGSLGVYRLTNPATFSTFIQSPSFSSSNPLTVSLYVKSTGSGNDNFNFYTGATNVSDLKTATSEWQRFDYTADGSSMYIVNDGDTYITDIYIWGAQAEALSYATSYIPTYGSTVTRATETLTGSGNSTLINSTEGVLYAEIAALENTNTDKNISISDGTSPNRIGIYYYGNTMSAVGYLGGANQFYLAKAITDVKEFIKVAVKYKENDFALWIDGEQIATDTSGTVPSGLNSLQFDNGGGSGDFYGNCKALAVFNALTDDELELLTGITNYGSFNELAQANGYTII